MGCLKAIVLRVPDLLHNPEILQVLPSILGEVILAVKENALKTRTMAHDLLISLAHRLYDVPADSVRDAGLPLEQDESAEHPLMAEYLCMILAGLAGDTPHMQSASVQVLSSLVYEFRGGLQQETLSGLLSTVGLLLHQKSRELIKSVLNFIKVCVIAMNKETLDQHIQDLVEGLTVWKGDSKNNFRGKVKELFRILIAQKGYEAQTLHEMVPDSHKKLIEHIQTTWEKEQRKKLRARQAQKKGLAVEVKENKSVESSDDEKEGEDDMEDDRPKGRGTKAEREARRAAKARGRQKGERLWIKDGDVNFMDEGVGSRIAIADPSVKDKRKVPEMEEDAQGRLLVMKKKRRSGGNQKRKRGEAEGGARKKKKKGTKNAKSAYMHLNPKQLNRREKHNTARKFDGVISAAKRGGNKGNKISKKNRVRSKKGGNMRRPFNS